MASNSNKLLLQLLLLLVAAMMAMALYGNSSVMLALAAPTEEATATPSIVVSEDVDDVDPSSSTLDMKGEDDYSSDEDDDDDNDDDDDELYDADDDTGFSIYDTDFADDDDDDEKNVADDEKNVADDEKNVADDEKNVADDEKNVADDDKNVADDDDDKNVADDDDDKNVADDDDDKNVADDDDGDDKNVADDDTESVVNDKVGSVDDGMDGADYDDDDDMEELHLELDCETATPFPGEVFDEQPDVSKVYLKPANLPECIFTKVGFVKFISVFGIPIIATNNVSSDVLVHAGVIFAKFLDIDEDGIVDDPESVAIMRKYRTIIGYVKGVDESNDLWLSRIRVPENSEFRIQFTCNMQFFEQWADDATPELHKVVSVGNEDDDVKFCDERSKLPFDWPLWYFPFITTYYGYLEKFDHDTVSLIKRKMEKAQELELFMGKYPDDLDMEMSDFFAWSLLTVLGGLKCHCDSDIHAWNVCELKELEYFDAEWLQFLQNLENIPHTLPDGKYKSPAVVIVQ